LALGVNTGVVGSYIVLLTRHNGRICYPSVTQTTTHRGRRPNQFDGKNIDRGRGRTVAPKEKRLEIADGGCAGLYLIVQPSGAKSWALRFRRPSGKTAKLTLGTVDLTNKEIDGEPVSGAPLSLAAARRLATEVHHQRARGRDVVAAKRRERLERQAHNERTFAAAALDFVRQHAQGRLRRWQERARILGVRETERGLELIPKGLADRWRDRPLGEIASTS
jgi:Arm DNA-binding domain